MRRTIPSHQWLPGLATIALLTGLAVETVNRPKPGEAEPYHAQIKALAATTPMQVGHWKGIDQEVSPAAYKLLKPNVVISRQYVNERTGKSVGFLLVHCKDARFIKGHYPPVCYPAHGSKQRSAEPRDWDVAGVPIGGTEYVFAQSDIRGLDKVVDNFIIAPGAYCRNMESVNKLAEDYTKRFYGASQVQVVFDNSDSWTDAERREVFDTIVEAYLPLIEQIRIGNLQP